MHKTGRVVEGRSNNGGQKKTQLYAHPEVEPMAHQRPRAMARQLVNSSPVCSTTPAVQLFLSEPEMLLAQVLPHGNSA